MHPIKLRGSLIGLREFTTDDLDAVYAIVGDERVTNSLSFDRRSLDEATDMLAHICERARQAPRNEYYLAVELADDQLIGFARLGLNGVKAAKLGFAIAADHWGRGYATDAARTIIDFGFRDLQLHRISAAIGPRNAASLAVARRLGMKHEGCIRDHVFTNGAWRDSHLFAVLAHEWSNR